MVQKERTGVGRRLWAKMPFDTQLQCAASALLSKAPFGGRHGLGEVPPPPPPGFEGVAPAPEHWSVDVSVLLRETTAILESQELRRAELFANADDDESRAEYCTSLPPMLALARSLVRRLRLAARGREEERQDAALSGNAAAERRGAAAEGLGFDEERYQSAEDQSAGEDELRKWQGADEDAELLRTGLLDGEQREVYRLVLDYVCELDVHERQVGAVLRRHGHSPTPTMRASATPQEHAGLDEIEITPLRPSLPKARRRARTDPRGEAGTNVPFSNGMDDEDAREPPISTDEESDHVSIRTEPRTSAALARARHSNAARRRASTGAQLAPASPPNASGPFVEELAEQPTPAGSLRIVVGDARLDLIAPPPHSPIDDPVPPITSWTPGGESQSLYSAEGSLYSAEGSTPYSTEGSLRASAEGSLRASAEGSLRASVEGSLQASQDASLAPASPTSPLYRAP